MRRWCGATPGIRRGREPGAGGGMAGGDASGTSSETGARERGGAGGDGEGVGESEGGASLPDAEAAVRVWQGALPGAGEEHGTPGITVRLRQPANGGGSTGGGVGPGTGLYGPLARAGLQQPRQGRKAKCRPATPGPQFSCLRSPENTTQAKPTLVQSIHRTRENSREKCRSTTSSAASLPSSASSPW